LKAAISISNANHIPSMANVIGIDVGAARPSYGGDHIYDFTPEYHVMCTSAGRQLDSRPTIYHCDERINLRPTSLGGGD